MATPYSYDVRCKACKTTLRLMATREKARRTKTVYAVSCPNCKKEIRGEMPLGIDVSSLQVVWFERPSA